MQSLSSLLCQVNDSTDWSRVVSRLIKNKAGVTAIEYGLIAALIAIAAVVVMGTVGTDLTSVFSQVASDL